MTFILYFLLIYLFYSVQSFIIFQSRIKSYSTSFSLYAKSYSWINRIKKSNFISDNKISVPNYENKSERISRNAISSNEGIASESIQQNNANDNIANNAELTSSNEEIQSLEQTDEITSDELFILLSNGKQFVTLKDVKQWVYIREMLASGELQPSEISKLFTEAGASQGRLDLNRFTTFVELFVNKLGLDAEYEDIYEDVNGQIFEIDEDNQESINEENKLIASENDNKSYLIDDTTDTDDYSRENVLGDRSGEQGDYDISNTVAESVFKQLSGKDGRITLKKLIAWDYCQALIQQGHLSERRLVELAEQAIGKEDGMGLPQFAFFLEKIVKSPQLLVDEGDPSSDSDDDDNDDDYLEEDEEDENINDVSMSSDDDANNKLMKDNKYNFVPYKDLPAFKGIEEEEYDSDEDRELTASVFKDLAGNKGYITAKDLLNWDFVMTAIGEVSISTLS
jgi:hypothetical protein